MNQARFVQEGQAIQELLGENPDQCGTKTPELVLLDQFVQVDAEKLEDETQMLPVDERILESQQMVVVVLVELRVELVIVSTENQVNVLVTTYQVQDRHFHHTLIKVRSSVLDDLDCHHFLCLQILAFDNLTKSSLTQHVKNQIPVPEKCV